MSLLMENYEKRDDMGKKRHVRFEEPVKTEEVVVEETPLVEVEEEIKEPPLTSFYIPWTGIVACEKASLNVRKGPGIEFENLPECPTVAKGSEIDVIGESGDWLNVKVGGEYFGFVMKKFISK